MQVEFAFTFFLPVRFPSKKDRKREREMGAVVLPREMLRSGAPDSLLRVRDHSAPGYSRKEKAKAHHGKHKMMRQKEAERTDIALYGLAFWFCFRLSCAVDVPRRIFAPPWVLRIKQTQGRLCGLLNSHPRVMMQGDDARFDDARAMC